MSTTPAWSHPLSRPDVASPRADVRACRRGVRDDERPALLRDALDRDDRVGAFGDDAARGDPHRLAGLQAPVGGAAGRDPGDDRKRPWCVGGPQREAVHRRAVEARQVDDGETVLGEHTARRVLQRHGLGGQGANALQDARQRLLHGQEIGHRDDATHGVRSGA